MMELPRERTVLSTARIRKTEDSRPKARPGVQEGGGQFEGGFLFIS